MQRKEVKINSAGLSLEASLLLPDLVFPCPGVVLCHPHPLYGGDMHNNVTISMARFLAAAGLATLLFNFRGVGRSEGNFDNGVGETEDALAVLSFISGLKEINPLQIGIAGYSFGGLIALKAGERSNEAKAIAGISPVIRPGLLRECDKPKLIICGEKDNMVSAAAVLQEAARMAEPKKMELIAGADHFWMGIEYKAAGPVASFFKDTLLRNGEDLKI